eukprot:GILJ01017614.1.p1 GENE.GILJ01017614.1~~GILJ01017614.1.p1  ORF type:complete len:201 (-),score=34.65 GILJ01017614.1:18-620(-)
MSTVEKATDSAPSRARVNGGRYAAHFHGITAKELFTWARPVATATVVGLIVAGLLIFSYFEYTFVLFSCRVLQLGFAAFGGLHYSKQLNISAEDFRADVAKAIDSAKPVVAGVANSVFRLLAWEEPSHSIAFLLGTMIIAFFSGFLEDSFIILLLSIIAFGGTPIYFKFQKEIDPHVHKAVAHIKKLVSQIPIGKKSKTA